ncbi:MAG TPA: DUF5808 domain-containing protein [Acidimicrobiales bacterium]|nr:DUF5808 domain-containing protein [Acidimicrobiales bacterium]
MPALGRRRRRRRAGARPLRLAAIALAVAAVVKELRLPRAERTWHGTVAGFVPYEFRVPTPNRVRERVWSPESRAVLSPAIFGVGWTLNVGRVVSLARRRSTG